MLTVLLLAALDLRIDYTRQSLTATYRHYTQYIDGVPVVGGEVIERESDGISREVYRSLAADPHPASDHLLPLTREKAQVVPLPRERERVALSEAKGRVRVNVNGEARPAHRVIVEDQPYEPVARYVDDETGDVLREVPLFFHAKGRVFVVNPVATLNAPELRDQNDAASAVPDAAYTLVDLLDLAPAGMLSGPNVKIIDVQAPFTPHADAAQPLLFDRSQPQFEEVNVYYAIDRSQRYLQSIGFTGPRRVVGYPIAVDPHALDGADNSLYESSTTPGQGLLFFGDGGTDDAEDTDIVLHEYTHAIQDWIAPGAFFGSSASEARALAEGIADYWAFSQTYVPTVASGRDPYCLGDWDARCDGDDPSQQCGYPPGADCLRRLDSTKTMADFQAINRPGQEHANGTIWSSALREIFEGLARRHSQADGSKLADQIVIESMFGVPPDPTFAVLADHMVNAVNALSPNDGDIVCAAMVSRRILAGSSGCNRTPLGGLTIFQSTQQALSTPAVSTLVIDDPRTIDRLAVQVDVGQAARGDVSVVLIAPDRTTAVLQAASTDRTPSTVVTYGVNATSADSLGVFRGHAAAGTWTLRVSAGVLRSWSLLIQFAGDAPLAARPVSLAPRKHVAAVAHTSGVGGTTYISDVRIFNRGSSPAHAMAVYTPDAGGFAAVKLVVAPKQILALDDIVRATMQDANGLGSLELQGEVGDLVVTSRTYTAGAIGTFGQFIPSADTSAAIGGATHSYATHLRTDTNFRSNIGFTEVAGVGGTVVVRVGDATREVPVAPFQHWQMPAFGTGDIIADFSVVSGGARILAYGSMIDNRSGDAIYVPARVASNVARVEYAPAISATGALGTRWSTEVVLSQVADAPALVGAAFAKQSISIGPIPSILRFTNFLVEAFNRDQTLGLLRLSLAPGVIATARIFTSSDGSSYGQFVPFADGASGADLMQLESSDAFRTNIGAANIGAAAVVARFTAFDDAGVELGFTERVLQPMELFQLPLRSFVARDVTNARVRVDGDVLAYASVIDNRSGDAIYIPAQ